MNWREITTENDQGKYRNTSTFDLLRKRDQAAGQMVVNVSFPLLNRTATTYPATPTVSRRIFIPSGCGELVFKVYASATTGTGYFKGAVTEPISGASLSSLEQTLTGAYPSFSFVSIEWLNLSSFGGKGVDLTLFMKHGTFGGTVYMGTRDTGLHLIGCGHSNNWVE